LLFAACKQPSSPDPTPPASPGTEQETSDTKPETPSGSDTEPETPSGSDTKPETPSGSDSKPETPSDSDTEPETPSGSDTEPETPSGSDTKPETPSGSDTKPEEPDTPLQEFNDVASLSEWLNAQVQNTAEHPYRVKVKNIDLTNKSTSKSGNTLRTLYSALSRYVALDLSESTGESIFNVTAESVPNKANVVSIILPETVTSVLMNTFTGCTNLTSITMPKVTSIAKSAFKGLEQLKSVSMPEIVTLENGDSSSTGVFYGCTALESVVMPKIQTIGDYAFRRCSALESITLGSTPPTLGATVLTNADAFKIFYVPSNALPTYQNTSQVGWDEGMKNKVVAIAK
jgi:hypothetical protein